MNQSLLKKYSLFPDLNRLNHYHYYQDNFDTVDIVEHFAAIRSNLEWKSCRDSCQFYLKNLRSTTSKDVYVIMKWLVTTHKLINAVVNPYLVQAISDSINRIAKIQCQELIDDYIQNELISPYKQYLQKLCFMIIRKLTTKQQKQRPKFEKQNSNDDLSIHFFKLNLVRYALKEFQGPSNSLLGFFTSAYPYLSQFSRLIASDLQFILKELHQQANLNFPGINRKQIQNLQTSITFFSNKLSKDQTFLETPIKSDTINDFFSSRPPSACKFSRFLKETDRTNKQSIQNGTKS